MKLFGFLKKSNNKKTTEAEADSMPLSIDEVNEINEDTEVIIKSGMVIKDIAGKTVAVPTGDAGECFRGMITLNPTSEFIIRQLMKGQNTPRQIAKELQGNFDVELCTAEQHTLALIKELIKIKIVQPKG